MEIYIPFGVPIPQTSYQFALLDCTFSEGEIV